MKMSRAVVTVGLVLGLSGAASAWAGAPATGLGQPWPNATDLSRSPHYHVYTFVQNGVRFIQVNGSNGTVLGAIGTASGQYIVLPIGNPSQVSTPQQSATTTTALPAAGPTTVYNDGTNTVTATPMSDGTTTLVTSAICSDPAACGSHFVKQVQ